MTTTEFHALEAGDILLEHSTNAYVEVIDVEVNGCNDQITYCNGVRHFILYESEVEHFELYRSIVDPDNEQICNHNPEPVHYTDFF
jgi:hypothetical protein